MKFAQILEKSSLVLIVIVSLLVVPACRRQSSSPVNTSKQFMNALLNHNRVTLSKIVDPNDPCTSELNDFSRVFQGLQILFEASNNKMRLKNPKYRIVQVDENQAIVQFTAEVFTRISNVRSVDPMELNISLIRSNKQWYVRPSNMDIFQCRNPSEQLQPQESTNIIYIH